MCLVLSPACTLLYELSYNKAASCCLAFFESAWPPSTSAIPLAVTQARVLCFFICISSSALSPPQCLQSIWCETLTKGIWLVLQMKLHEPQWQMFFSSFSSENSGEVVKFCQHNTFLTNPDSFPSLRLFFRKLFEQSKIEDFHYSRNEKLASEEHTVTKSMGNPWILNKIEIVNLH